MHNILIRLNGSSTYFLIFRQQFTLSQSTFKLTKIYKNEPDAKKRRLRSSINFIKMTMTLSNDRCIVPSKLTLV